MIKQQAFKLQLQPNRREPRPMRRFAGWCRYAWNRAHGRNLPMLGGEDVKNLKGVNVPKRNLSKRNAPEVKTIRTHDSAYKTLLSVAMFVEAFVKCFLPSEVFAESEGLELDRLPSDFVTGKGTPIYSDRVWRLRHASGNQSLFVIFEFQSTVDKKMTFRLEEYNTALRKDLASDSEMLKNESAPAFAGIVVYNGSEPWNAPMAAEYLVIENHFPKGVVTVRVPFFLYDVLRMDPSYLKEAGLAGYFGRLEQAEDLDCLLEIAEEMAACIPWKKFKEMNSAYNYFLLYILYKGCAERSKKRSNQNAAKFMIDHIPDTESIEETIMMIRKELPKFSKHYMEQGAIQQARETIARYLAQKYSPVPADLVAGLDKFEEISVLNKLLDECLASTTLLQFTAAMEREAKAARA